MKKEDYNNAYRRIEKRLGKENCLAYEDIEGYFKQIRDKNYIDEEEYKELKEISELFSLRWGILFYAFDLNSEDEVEILKQKVVYRSLLSNIVSNCMAIINLAQNGFDF